MKYISNLIICVITMVFSQALFAQDVDQYKHSITFKTQNIQIKDFFTYGLAYSGINLSIGYCFDKLSERNLFNYETEVSFGGIFNKGAGFAWRFVPVDVFYGYRHQSKPIFLGLYLSADYQWQQYAELQGGRLFWFSNIELGPKFIYKLHLNSSRFDISFSNSLLGLASRPTPATESYFYNFSFSEFINVVHQNLKFGSFNLFNRSNVKIAYQYVSWNRFKIAYDFEYYRYHIAPKLSFLSHSLTFNLKI